MSYCAPGSRPSRCNGLGRFTIRLACRLGVVLATLGAVSVSAAQECAPHEVPLPPDDPGCDGFFERARGCPQQREWRDASRTFAAGVSLTTAASEEQETAEWSFPVVGCAGAIVVPVIGHDNVHRLDLSLVTPGGVTLFNEQRSLREAGTIEFSALELPQSGRYLVQVKTWARAKEFETCTRAERLRCVERGMQRGYPRDIEVTWRGTGGLQPMLVGDVWRPVIEPSIPLSRRVRLEPGESAVVRVEAATTNPVQGRLSVARGGLISEQRFPSGTGVLHVPAEGAEQEILLRLALEGRNVQPFGLTVIVDTVSGTHHAGIAGSESVEAGSRNLAAGMQVNGRVASGASAERWTFRAARGERYNLEVVPSGLAGLVLRAVVFNIDTEEIVDRRDNIGQRTQLSLRIPSTGRYVVQLESVRVQNPDPDGRALYTLRLAQVP